MASVRLRGRHTDHLLVPARKVRQVADPGVARALARRMLESPDLPRLRPGGAVEPSEDELVRALLAGELVVVEVEGPPRLLDAPRVRALLDLAGPMDGVPEPVRTRSWVGVRVVDPRGRPVPGFTVRVDDPAGKRHHATLDGDGRARMDALTYDGSCVVTLTPLPDEGR
jgi:hypothetical protein